MKPIRKHVLVALLASACFAIPAAHGQTLLRGAGVLGLPDMQIDLSAPASQRYAIVIGNGDYVHAPDLNNANADARLVAAFLRDQGYEVLERHNLDKRGFEDVLRRVLFDVNKESEVVFYYAGHGMQIGAGNYIVPVDAALDNAYDVPFETVSLDSLVSIIGARARVQMVILDSCRDNPFADRRAMTTMGETLSEIRSGFGALAAPVNSLLVFSTSPGAVALDGTGENSPFTLSLIEAARSQPDASMTAVLEQVRRLVYSRTEGQQVPWESSTLVEPIAFSASNIAPVNMAETGAGGATRTLAFVGQAVAATSEQVALVAADVSLTAMLDPEVEFSGALRGALSLGPDDALQLIEPPNTGRIAAVNMAGLRGELPATTATRGLQELIYANTMPQTRASTVQAQSAVFTDDFRIAVNGREQVVRIALEGNECDIQAGDHLDPEGSGLTRFPNEIEPLTALAACQAAVAENPDVGRFHYQEGRALLALRRFEEARAAFERARDRGHTRAYYALGNLIASEAALQGGRASTRVPDEALALFILGVDRGDPYAMYALGRQLLRYETSAELQAQGYRLLMRSLEVGHTFAMNELGYYYLDEDSDHYDPGRGLRYLNESAAREDIYGFYNLGIVYQYGLGGQEIDAALARNWLEKAAEGGHPGAPTNLGVMYEVGPLPRDRARALGYYLEGLSNGDGYGGTNAAWMLIEGTVTGYDRSDAAIFAAKAGALRDEAVQESARDALASIGNRDKDRAAQRLIVELGGTVEADGAFGPGSQAALEAMAASLGVDPYQGSDRAARLIWLAGLVWQQSAFRVDLY
ncbi:MAG: caspase family protein [Paracoccaceae bacterium]